MSILGPSILDTNKKSKCSNNPYSPYLQDLDVNIRAINFRHQQEEQMLNNPYSPYLQDFFTVLFLYKIQPSWTFKLHHATFQHNDETSSSFPVTLWHWVNIKVIQTGIKQ